jgi:hypothetical protein
MAEALPALWPKGAMESAEELGKIKHLQHRYINMRKMVMNKSPQPA